MDTIEFWIWEHATKHGMTKVLRKIKSSFSQISVPNSWLSALYLKEIKNEWKKQDNKITSEVLNTLRKCLTNTFKHYIKDLKYAIRTSDCIQLELYCKAAFLVLRSSSCTSAVKLKAKEALFPCWNMVVWTKTKNYFGLKDDVFMEEIKTFYSELRSKLGQTDRENEILDTFGEMMKKNFPSLISFLQKIKLSRLETIQKNKMKLEKQFDFLRFRLSDSLLNEPIILDLLEDIHRKKMAEKVLKFWNESKQVEATVETSIEATLYVLPPDPKFESNDNQFYPACFLTNPYMPTHIVLDNGCQLEAILINRNVPRKSDGEAFEPHWFADTRLPVIKREKDELSIDCDSKHITGSVPERLDVASGLVLNLERSPKSSCRNDGLEKEEIFVINTSDEEPLTGIRNDIRSLANYNLPCCSERAKSVQSWVDNSHPHSPSSVEDDNDVSQKDSTISPGEPARCKSVLDTVIAPLEAESQQETVTKSKTTEQTEPEEDITELKSDTNLSHVEVQKSFEACMHLSDSDFVSSTTASSCNRIQTRNRYTYLTQLANQKKYVSDSQSHEGDSDIELKVSRYGFSRRLRNLPRGITPDSVSEQTNVRLKRKCRKLSSSTSSSGCLATPKRIHLESPTSDGVPTSYKTADSMEAKSEESWSGEKTTGQAGKWDGTPPLEEPSSNYHTPTQRGDSITSETELVTNTNRTGFKRKLYDDEEVAEDTPKSKRIPVGDVSNGRHMLPSVIEKLKLDSEKLRMNDPCFAGHYEKLDLCIQRVSLCHQKLLRRMSADLCEEAVVRKTFSIAE